MAKGNFCVIGLGNFGAHCARSLFERGNDVIAVDRSREKVNNIRDFCSQAIVADATKKEMLEPLALEEMDAVIISVGENISTSILITLFLAEMGVKNIVVKALSEDHSRILEKVGANRIVFPEKDTAIKTAQILSDPNLADFVPLSGDYMIAEIPLPSKLSGKTIAESQLRNKYNIQIIAIKSTKAIKPKLAPTGDLLLKEDDILIVLGLKEDIDRFKDL